MKRSSIGDYEILEEIGSGPLGSVVLAEHRFLKRVFALKILPEELAADPSFIKRFEKGVSILSSLEHPHLVKIHNVSFSDGRYYLITDLVLGSEGQSENLAQYLARLKRALTEEEIVNILMQLADALDYAHERKEEGESFTHLGIKLNNILIRSEKGQIRAQLSDFGLSKVVGTGLVLSRTLKALSEWLSIEPGYTLSQEGQERYFSGFQDPQKLSKLHLSFLQTYAFLAPEQKNIVSTTPVNHKADIYAFGVLAYYLIMGQFPEGFFDLPSKRFPAYKHHWDLFISQCLSTDPKRRPESLKQALALLMQDIQGSLIAPASENKREGGLKPLLKPQEITRPEFEPDPGAIFQTEMVVARYQPKQTAFHESEPLFTEMVVIDGGFFFRGSNHGARDEMPRHAVNISSFAIDIHPVTNEQFVRFLEAMGGEKDANNNDIIRLRDSRIKRSGGKLSIESGYAKHPVVGVAWYGAVAYAKWIGKRLPTEAEWEIAASGGLEECIYPTGKNIERSQANFFSSDTTAVMSYPPNDYGLYDIVGNVYEWCQDWYDYHYYDESVQEPNNPKGPVQGVYRILRGGCWKSLKEDLRCAHRHRNNPGTMNGTYGFRCCADVS